VSKTFPESERRRLLAKIHLAKKQLGWDDETYRAMLAEIAGVDSAAKLSVSGFKKVIDHLYRIGFRDKAPTGKLSPSTKGRPYKTRQDKAIALWIELGKAGKVRDRSHDALNNYVWRFLGKNLAILPGVEPLYAASDVQMGKVIKALEGWLNDGSSK
jgi:phage gp16-like protein